MHPEPTSPSPAGRSSQRDGADEPDKRPSYVLVPKTTPLPSQADACHTPSRSCGQDSPGTSEFLRPAGEDDDGYDPYSDRQPSVALFEEDPWA